MRVLLVNEVCGHGSTGHICTDLAETVIEQGGQAMITCGRRHAPEQYRDIAVQIGSRRDLLLHVLRARLDDGAGFGSRRATERFVQWVREYNPDLIHLHNLHGYYLNIEVLSKYLKTCGRPVIWTLHDQWAFTGHTPYCEPVGCDRWKSGCGHCPQLAEYPKSYIDRSTRNWNRRKKAFTGIPHLTLAVPSSWMESLVHQSFLSEYPVRIIRNGIRLEDFHPVSEVEREECRRAYGIEKGQIFILGVASAWEKSKGLDDFVRLSSLLSGRGRIVLVGLSRRQLQNLPDQILGLQRTENVEQLRQLYAAADVFVNPTYEENFPTTNLEAQACGTPVITYETGGSPESLLPDTGCVVPVGNTGRLAETIRNLPEMIAEGKISRDVCARNGRCYSKEKFTGEYMKLYEEVLG